MKRSPKDVLDSNRIVSRRALMIGGIQLSAVAALGLRLRSMQIDRADEFRLLSDGNSIKIRLLPPARGLIVDRTGFVVAGNEANYRVTITREEAGEDEAEVAAVLDRLAALIPIPPEERQRLMTEMARRSPSTPFAVRDRLTWEEFAAVAVNAPALPGVTVEAGLSRVYPRAADFSHVMGYVGPVSDYDLSKMTDPDPVLLLPEFQFGKVGIEAKLEEQLRGKAGTRRVEVNSGGREMRELSRQEGQQGATIQLTIDAALQNYAVQRLGTESGAAVAMDIHTGDVLAIASSPGFDPNLFVRGISSTDYKSLTENDHRPLADKTVQGVYPPGSTFKMVTLLAGLSSGLLDPGERFYCPGHLEAGGRRFHCWRRGGHGSVSAVASLEQSCDVFYYELAQRIGIDRIGEMAKHLGIGVRHDLPMSAVAEGIAPTRAWKKERYDQEWQVGDSINASIGQGYVLASPLQLAVMTARVATGRAVEPRLIRARDGVPEPVPDWPDLGLDPRHLAVARAGMDAVMNGKSGTAAASKIVLDEWRMAGKTGTSQVRNITAAERARGVIRNEDLPWERRDHALFVCYAPVQAPRIAVSLIIEHGGGGSAVAAPVARDILLFALAGGLPPLEAYPPGQRDKVEEQRRQMRLAPATVADTAPARTRA